MAIISAIGRKSWKVRLLFLVMYLFLIAGGATMVYPFLLMLSGSTKSAVDIRYFDAVPTFWHDDAWLCRKHLEGLFNERLQDLNVAYDLDETSFDLLADFGEPNEVLAHEWETFLNENQLPSYSFAAGYLSTQLSRTISSAQREFKKRLQAKYGGKIEDVNRILGTDFAGWYSVYIQVPCILMRREKPQDTPFAKFLTEFLIEQPYGLRYYFSPQGFYKKQFLKTQYTTVLSRFNTRHQTNYRTWGQITLPRRYPADGTPQEQDDWEKFVRSTLASQWIRVNGLALPEYHGMLKAKYLDIKTLNLRYGKSYSSFDDVPVYVGNIENARRQIVARPGGLDAFNRECGTAYASIDAVPFSEVPPCLGLVASDWDAFLTGYKDPLDGRLYAAPLESLEIYSVEFLFQDWMMARHKSIEAMNGKFGTHWEKTADIRMPQRDLHLSYFKKYLKELRWEFTTRNYKAVAEYMLFHGRGIFNTVLYCALAIATALLVNPLAAYAMSRFRMPSSYKILLFLMCTMTFPPMVTAIPSFIMLRQFNLLNTFAALILPGMANGYSIFLLKGFFDSLPQELYESAQLDGANEWVLFWQITMGLSKPILAVVALNAFTAAYSNFMFAFVVCQDRRMWTMMVWLYELQQQSGQAVMYASLVIAAIPTFLIFLFCQNIIMRGIVVPSEK